MASPSIGSAEKTLLAVLGESSPLTPDEIARKLRSAKVLGFGVDAADVINRCIDKKLIEWVSDDEDSLILARPFLTLERRAEWGDPFLVLPDDPQGASPIVFHPLIRVEVRWPDATFSTEHVFLQNGVAGVNIRAKGISTWIPLDYPGVEVRFPTPEVPR